MEWRRYSREFGAVHSIPHLQALSDSASLILCVSPRTLYILQNLGALDATFSARYADVLQLDSYQRVSPDSANWELFQNAVNNLQLELEMACDLQVVLEEIRDALRLIAAQTQDTIIQQSICCDDGVFPDAYDPDPPSTSAPDLDEAKCQRAYTVALDWRDASMKLFQQYQLYGGVIGGGIIALVLAALSPPVAIVVAVGALLLGAAAILELSEIEIEEALNDLVPDVACAIYSSSSVTGAEAALDAVLAGPTIFGTSGTTILRDIITTNTLNPVFDETLTPRSDAPSDCSACQSAGCDGVYEFGSSTDPLAGPYGGPGDETLIWSGGPGYDGQSGRAVLDNPAPQAGDDVYLEVPTCEGVTVSTGGTVSVRVNMPNEAGNANNFYLLLATAEYGDIQGNNVVGDGTWQTASVTIPEGADGDELVFIRLIFYKYQSSTPCSVLLDHLVISL